MTKFLVTCTKIYNGTMFVDAENNEEALDIAQNKLNENVDCINWDFGEATADIADEDEEDNPTTTQPKYNVGEYIVWHHYDYETCTEKDDIFQITDIKNGKYICSDGKQDDCDFLDYDKDFRLAEPTEISKYFEAHHKYNVGEYVESGYAPADKIVKIEYDTYYFASGEQSNILELDNDADFHVKEMKYKVGDIVKSDNSPADKIVSVNSETYFFESGEQSDITALDDDANFYLVQPPKYKVGDYSDGVPIAIFDDDENHHTETFHREDFQPFDKVLVRDDNRCAWVCAFFSHIAYSSEVKPYVTCGGEVWEQCVPYNNDTALYLGTKQDYNGKYQTW